jgi:hypothetical protein
MPSARFLRLYQTQFEIHFANFGYLVLIAASLQFTKDKESGIVNDPNEFSEDPRYILDLVKRVVTVSIETLKIVRELPELSFD